jgi:NAD/NADP transhydrogenase alpha subunit
MEKTVQAMSGSGSSKAHDRMYHVSHDGQRWTVDSDEGRTAHFASDRHVAIGLAIRTAQHDHADGLDVIVCVEQPDGSFVEAWSSP